MKNGFTTIELVLTLVIISIITAVAYSSAPDIDMYDNAKARVDAISVLRTAQKVSIARRNPIYINMTSDKIMSCLDAACVTPARTMEGTPIATDIYTGKYSTGTAAFSFDSSGRVSSAVVINVSGAAPIIVENGTGYAH